MQFNEWLQSELEKRKLTRRQFCDMVGCGRSTLTLWLLGERHPNKPNQKKIVKALADGNEALRVNLILSLWEVE